jgi:pheromone shutdown-related protein TraB
LERILLDNRITISLQKTDIILIGTAHVSRGSIEEVQNVIALEKPDNVCIELDEGRYKSMRGGEGNEDWEKLNISKVIREGKGFLLIANLVLASFQRRMGDELGVKPGDEMKAAITKAEELGVPFAFCDRQVQITLARAWGKCGFWSKCKLLASLIASAVTTEKMDPEEIERLKDSSALDSMMAELASYLPKVKETLIDERDKYLAAKIYDVAENVKKLDGAKEKATVVAVVGAGHLKGLAGHLERIAAGEESSNVEELNVLPPKGWLSKAIGWIFPLVILGLIAAGFVISGPSLSGEILLRWLLWNGSLAALGSIIALAHPLAILVSIIGAPLGTISPVLSVGMFSGVVQAWACKPQVGDAENLSKDVASLRGIYHNRITRALLVFFLASLGGAVGNIISIPSIAGLFISG